MKRKMNLGRSSNIIKRQRLLRLSQNNNGSPDNCNINSDSNNNDDNVNNISITNSIGSINENNINNNFAFNDSNTVNIINDIINNIHDFPIDENLVEP
jgi:hypothetical protein